MRSHWPIFAVVLALLGMLCAQDGKDEVYHPPKDSAGREYDTFAESWLAAMNEPSLVPTKGRSKDFELRFFWLRSFRDPISIRVWRTGSNYRMRAVRMVKQSHYGPAPIAEDTARDLKPEEWAKVTRLMEDKTFWTPLSQAEHDAIPKMLKDGSRWFFERLADGKRSYLELLCAPDLNKMTQSAKHASNVRDFDMYVRLGSYLLEIAGLTPKEPRDFY